MAVETKVIAVIPARWDSTRFPGKPLAKINDKPMIQWVVERVLIAKFVTEVIVATDDKRIYSAVEEFGGHAVMTAKAHASGSDRIAEVASALSCDIVVNVQGDEPLISPDDVDLVVSSLINDPSVKVSTLKTRILRPEDLLDPNVVKVVTDMNGFALYFSRAPIPFARDGAAPAFLGGSGRQAQESQTSMFKHIGVYAFTRPFLLEFSGWEKSGLEETEKLEQLRILERGVAIKVEETAMDSVGVDCPEDVAKVEAVFNARNLD